MRSNKTFWASVMLVALVFFFLGLSFGHGGTSSAVPITQAPTPAPLARVLQFEQTDSNGHAFSELMLDGVTVVPDLRLCKVGLSYDVSPEGGSDASRGRVQYNVQWVCDPSVLQEEK